MASELSRRSFVAGSAAFGVCGGAPAAQAFWPAVVSGLGTLVTLWNGVKMAEDLYDRIFPKEKKVEIVRERERIVERPFVVVPDYYGFENRYRFRGFADREPGCLCYHRRRPRFENLLCSSEDDTTAITTGFIVALSLAIEALRSKYAEDNICAYTRPRKSVLRAEPWASYDNSGLGVESKMSYYSPEGSVALKWFIPDRRNPVSRGSFRVRDNHSGIVVVEGETPTFSIAG